MGEDSIYDEGTVVPHDAGKVVPHTQMPADAMPETVVPPPSTTEPPRSDPPAPSTRTPAESTDLEEPLFPPDNGAEPAATPTTPPATEPAAPTTEPAAPTTEPDAGTDDIFPPLEEEPAAPAEGEGTDENLDDLFGTNLRHTSRVLTLNDQPWRTWSDNTGWYETRGQLVSISDTNIKLYKDNGNHCTVPLQRLSQSDIEYVRTIARQPAERDAISIAGN